MIRPLNPPPLAFLAATVCLFAAGCAQQNSAAPSTPPSSVEAQQSALPSRSTADFSRVAARVKHAADGFCRERRPGDDPDACDHVMVISGDDSSRPNAFLSQTKDGKPVISMTPSLLAQMRDDDEIASVLSHEAAHHVGRHIDRMNERQPIDAFIPRDGSFGQAEPKAARTHYSGRSAEQARGRALELEADWVGAFIMERSGYDPEKGATIFMRYAASVPASASIASSHPSANQRLSVVLSAKAEILRQRAAGLDPRPESAGAPER